MNKNPVKSQVKMQTTKKEYPEMSLEDIKALVKQFNQAKETKK